MAIVVNPKFQLRKEFGEQKLVLINAPRMKTKQAQLLKFTLQ
jgi:hypothetical protein